ncbi:MAG: 6-carboxytetrahydropterin synthase [Saprospiraceae bacterium]|nr:6-carboxytetrahydropterin synthase [Saprospiraceae bacterium]
MYTVRIRKHMLIAHSLPSPAFGPAQGLHGATYVVDASFKGAQLDANNIVIDIDLASRMLEEVLQPLNYKNLDDLPEFAGKLTTTEFLAAHIHGRLAVRIQDQFKGELEITLGESHVAWASYTAPV